MEPGKSVTEVVNKLNTDLIDYLTQQSATIPNDQDRLWRWYAKEGDDVALRFVNVTQVLFRGNVYDALLKTNLFCVKKGFRFFRHDMDILYRDGGESLAALVTEYGSLENMFAKWVEDQLDDSQVWLGEVNDWKVV